MPIDATARQLLRGGGKVRSTHRTFFEFRALVAVAADAGHEFWLPALRVARAAKGCSKTQIWFRQPHRWWDQTIAATAGLSRLAVAAVSNPIETENKLSALSAEFIKP
jgi:hypothetical protein